MASPFLLRPFAGFPAAIRSPAATLILLTVCSNLLSLGVPILTMQAYDRILPRQAGGTLVMLAGGVLVAIVLDSGLRLTRSWLLAWQSLRGELALSDAAARAVLSAPPARLQGQPVAAHLQDFNAIAAMRETFSGQRAVLMAELAFAALFLGLIAWLAGWLALAPLAMLALYAASAWRGGQQMKRVLHSRDKTDEERTSLVIESLAGIHTVKALTMEKLLQRRFEAIQGASDNLNAAVARIAGRAAGNATILSQLMIIVVVAAGAHLAVEGRISSGTLIACVMLSGRMMQPVQRLLAAMARWQDVETARQRVARLVTPPARAEAIVAPNSAFRLQMIQAGFDQPGRKAALRGVSLTIEPGEAVALQGPAGSGKTTLLRLMAGINPPATGRVLLGGHDVSALASGDRAAMIGLLPSQGALLRGTLLDNLTGFAPERQKQALDIAALLGIDTAVARLPRGYATLVHGTAVDAVPPGLRQRIAIARALAARPRIILFDEADRALDTEGYNYLFSLLGRLRGRATLVIASEDASWLDLCDRRIALNHGQMWPCAAPARERWA